MTDNTVIDETKISIELRNGKLSFVGQQVADTDAKPVEVELLMRIREDITSEQLADFIEELEDREDEFVLAWDVIMRFIEKALPIEDLRAE